MSFKPRYILAEEAEERIVALYRKETGDAAKIFNTAVDACQTIILDMYDNSSENVVPIVWCRDCKHWDTSWQNDYAPNYHYCLLVDGTRRDDFYCADAERKTDE